MWNLKIESDAMVKIKNFKFILPVFVISIFLNCFMVYGQTADKKEIITDMANKWAEAWKTRDGNLRYNIMSEKMKKEFETNQGTDNGKIIMSIRWSSPWVESYTVNVNEETDSAKICYIMTDSGGDYCIMWDYLSFSYNAGKNKPEVIACNTSDLFGYDKVSEIVIDNLTSASFGNIDESLIPFETYYKMQNAVKHMISSEFRYKNKFITRLDFEQVALDNIGKVITSDINMTVSYMSLPANPANDENLIKLKSENLEQYIKLFSEYNKEETENYILKVKFDLETEGIVSIDLQHKYDNYNN